MNAEISIEFDCIWLFSARIWKEIMEKRPLKGNVSSIPMSVPASYQSVGEKVSVFCFR